MIICSCNVISDHDITRVVDRLKQASPQQVITPDLVFKTLGRKSECGTCLASIVKLINQGDAASSTDS